LFIEHLSKSANVTASARVAGFDRRTAYAHRLADPEFAADWDDALEASAWPSAVSRGAIARSGSGSPRWRRCSNICARKTPSRITRWKASSGRRRKAEGKTPALGDHQARKLLDAPQAESIKSKRDRAILSTLLFHALRREELCKLKVKDTRRERKGVPHLKVSGKGGKTRYLPLHPGTAALIHDYLEVGGHGTDENGALCAMGRHRIAQMQTLSLPTAVHSWISFSTECNKIGALFPMILTILVCHG
jgi:integrase